MILLIIILGFIIFYSISSYREQQNELTWKNKLREYISFEDSISKRKNKLLETVTTKDRGTYSERQLVLKLLENEIPHQTIFHDLYVSKPNGTFSQIDLVVVTTAGVIVIEVKDYSGWIFGKGYQQKWTQVLSYGKKKFRFYNPILQNNSHISYLKNTISQFKNIPFYSVIVFYGDCELRDISFIPEGSYVVKYNRIMEVIKLIQSQPPAPYTDKYEIIRVFKQAVDNGKGANSQKLHSEYVKDLIGEHRVFD